MCDLLFLCVAKEKVSKKKGNPDLPCFLKITKFASRKISKLASLKQTYFSTNLVIFRRQIGAPSERLSVLKFLAKFSMSERSEFWNFALKKFQISEEKQRSRGVLSFCLLLLCTSKEKVSRHRRNTI